MITRAYGLSLAFLLSGIGLTACSTLTPQQLASKAEADMAARTPCCKDWRSAPVRPLPLEPTKFKMNETADVFLQDGERVYGVLLQLPAFASTYGITLSSKTQGTQSEQMVFAPRVKMMNERFEVTRSFDESDLRTRGGNPERTVYVNPPNANERFMLIHGSGLKSSYTKQVPIQTTQTISTGYGVMYWNSGADIHATIRSSPYGEIEIQTDGLTNPATPSTSKR